MIVYILMQPINIPMNDSARRLLFFIISINVLILLSVTAEAIDVSEIEDNINSIVHYAEEYEIGNINYLQLNVYGHKIRADLNLLLGGGIGNEWGRIPKENLEKALGTPTGHTNWLWIDNKHMDKRFDESMPQWEKIIFDGRKVRIIFNAFPSAIELENGDIFKYYSVDLNVKFKKKYTFDFDSRLDEITSLAADYKATETRNSGEAAVKKMLEAQRLWSGYVQENSEQCVAVMDGLFQPDEKGLKRREMEWRFPIFAGSDFDVMTNIHMCEECEWHSVWIDFWFEGRGAVNALASPELQFGKLEHKVDEDYFWTLTADELNQELKKAVFEIRDASQKFGKTTSDDFAKKFYFNRFKIQQINRILDGKYNEVQELDPGIAKRIESGELAGPGGCKNLGECKDYCEKRNNTDTCRAFTYKLRVDFLEQMFAGFDIEKTPFERIEWERRLIENTETRQDSWCRHVNDIQCKDDEGCVDGICVSALGGNEICDNRIDDDNDRLSDCQDPDCWQERLCGKLCEGICNKDGGCWQASNELCSDVCKECWDCGGDEKCKNVCEAECWPCHNQEAIKNVCDDCRTCEDDAYGGCYTECKPCDECNTKRMEKMKAIFERAAREGIKTPGGCMGEEDCNRYCAEHGDECEILDELGFYSNEFDCNGECRECTICNYNNGDFKCKPNQHFESETGFCICNAGWYDCDRDWNNGCEADVKCLAGLCAEKCTACDSCKGGEECESMCLECNKCKNPDMPTFLCDGLEQSEPCKAEHICNGVKQKKPCEKYVCNGKESVKPCDEAISTNTTCGKNQVLSGNECVCRESFRDCDSDGNCESTKSCGLEICDDRKDNNNDGTVDCEDPKCNRQVCGTEGERDLLCIQRGCIFPEEELILSEPEPVCGNHICEKNESKESCPKDCVVCEAYEPPECPNGKIVWKGHDSFGCTLTPICVVTEKACEKDADCPFVKCRVSQCIAGECRVKELTTECEDDCKEGKTKKRECKDGSEIVTAVCSANEWIETGYDCSEVFEAPSVVLPEESENLGNETQTGLPKEAAETPMENPVNKTQLEIPAAIPANETVKPKETPNEQHDVLANKKIPKEAPKEQIAPEVEEKPREARSECVLASNCGGSQDVCSNGNCVTLPISVEKETSEEIPLKESYAPAGAPPENAQKEDNLPKETETPPEPERPDEAPPESPVAPPEVQLEVPPQVQEHPAEESLPTGNVIASFANFLKERLTGLAVGKEKSCEGECKPCKECNRKYDSLMKRIASGEIPGPNNCRNRGECETYCMKNEETKEECKSFFTNNGVETFNCWEELCSECDKCRFIAGELKCNANQEFNLEKGFCECNRGWYDCNGDWEDGCESSQQCGGCQSKADCAQDRCAPWGNVIQQFDCFKGEEWVEERGIVRALGDCRFYPTKRTEGGIYFDMWGDPFEKLQPIREAEERDMGMEWCEWELENNIKERMEIQKSFTGDSLRWFFEEYIPSSPSEWEKHIGGIYDSYWRIVNNNEWTTRNLICLGKNKLPEEYKPIDVTYNTEYGSVRIWEEETTTDFFGKPARILTPYMWIWVFPTKDFIKNEFQSAMGLGMVPGPEGNKKPELSPADIEEAKRDKELMNLINSLSEKYGGEAKFFISILYGNETVFNVLITVNPDIVIKVEPIKEYAEDYDARIIIEYDFFYKLISTIEKDVNGGQIQYPPWETTNMRIKDTIKNFVGGVKIFYLITSGVSSGNIDAEPRGALFDGLSLLKLMFERGPQ